MRKLVIVKPGCRELANHVWNYLSVYAYGLEVGAKTVNLSFLEWHQYFTLGWGWVPSFFGRIWRVMDSLYGSYVIRMHKPCTRLAVNEIVHLSASEMQGCDTTYCLGWFFRNPLGLARYRKELISAFQQKKQILENIAGTLAPLISKKLIGVQLRQEPYKEFPNGELLVSPDRVRHIVDEYLEQNSLAASDVAVVIVSDKDVDPSTFAGLTTHVSRADDVTNLFLLSRCSVVVAANSTFGNLAAWFGNVPHIVTTHEPIDWEYYRNTTEYFENKYATFAF